MELDEITPETTKNLILNNHNAYFTIKNLKKDFLKDIDPKEIHIYNEKHKSQGLGRRLGHAVRRLRIDGFVEKFNKHTYKFIRDPELQ